MSAMLLLVAAVVGSEQAAAANEDAEVRRYAEINDSMRNALRAEATAEDLGQRAVAVRQLTALYREILQDPRLETSDTLKSYKAKIWSRLTRIKADLQRTIDRNESEQRQQGPEIDAVALKQATQSLAAQMSLMNYTLGGPANVLSHSRASFGGRPVNDHGQELIDLIERTIKPDFWDVAGGPGSIFYYQPLMALVVRATSEVHGDVGGVLNALRRAGQ